MTKEGGQQMVKTIIIFAINVILDTSVMPAFEVFGLSPGLSIPTIVYLSLRAKNDKVTYYAIFLGLFLDIYFSNYLGVRALAFYLISYLVFSKKKMDFATLRSGLVATGLAIFFNELYMVLVGIISGNKQVAGNFLGDFAYGLLYKILVSLVVYILVYLILDKLVFKRKEKFY